MEYFLLWKFIPVVQILLGPLSPGVRTLRLSDCEAHRIHTKWKIGPKQLASTDCVELTIWCYNMHLCLHRCVLTSLGLGVFQCIQEMKAQ